MVFSNLCTSNGLITVNMYSMILLIFNNYSEYVLYDFINISQNIDILVLCAINVTHHFGV